MVAMMDGSLHALAVSRQVLLGFPPPSKKQNSKKIRLGKKERAREEREREIKRRDRDQEKRGRQRQTTDEIDRQIHKIIHVHRRRRLANVCGWFQSNPNTRSWVIKHRWSLKVVDSTSWCRPTSDVWEKAKMEKKQINYINWLDTNW